MERLTKRVASIEQLSTEFVPEDKRRTIVGEYSYTSESGKALEDWEDSEARRFRVDKYFERDLHQSVESFEARAEWAGRVGLMTTAIVLAAGIVVPIAIAASPSTWPPMSASPTLTIISLSVLTVLCKLSEYLTRAPLYRLVSRLGTASALLGSAGMNAWVAGASASQGAALGTGGWPVMVVVASGLALFAHLFSAIRRLPEMGENYTRVADEIRQTQRMYINSAGDYSGEPASVAWRHFVEQIELTLSYVSAQPR
jgi:hypothetical protein